MDIVIVKIGNGPILFYSGGSWSPEYPDATIYSKEYPAKTMARRLDSKGNEGVMVIGDYGLDTETVLS